MTAQNSHHAHRWWILAVVGIAQLMVVLDATIVNIALPSAQRALHFSSDNRQWIIAAYALAFGSLLLLGGKLSDLFGRKWTFIVGLARFATASAVGGASQSFLMLAVARTVNVVFAIVAIAGGLRFVRNVRSEDRPRIDVPGTLTVTGGLFAIVFGFSHAETAGWGSPLTIAMLIAGAGLLALFGLLQSRVAHPLLPLRVLAERNRSGSYLALLIAGAAMFGVFLFLTYYLQNTRGYSPITTGLAFLPMTATIMATAVISTTKLRNRFGPRNLSVLGMLQPDINSTAPILAH